MHTEQEKRLYYISNDEVDYERIELLISNQNKLIKRIQELESKQNEEQ